MPQFFPDGPAAVNLNAIGDRGGINLPPEPPADYDTPGMQGSMQQLLSENLGKFVLADFLVGVSSIVRRVGILYSVGRSFLVLYQEEFHVFQVCDIFSLKFVSFFPPGFEPSVEELMRGDYFSGILRPGTGGILTPDTSGSGIYNDTMSGQQGTMGRGGMGGAMNGGMSGGNGNRAAGNGHRTLGQR